MLRLPPYAYPSGFAAALGLTGEPWRAIWAFLRDRVHDDLRTNDNDRFEVASETTAGSPNTPSEDPAAAILGRPLPRE